MGRTKEPSGSLYAGGAWPKTTKRHPPVAPTNSAPKSSASGTGVTDPKDVQRMIHEARIKIDQSHRQNTAAIDRLMASLQHYVDQGNLVEQLARKTEECTNLQKTLHHQREENQRLQVSSSPASWYSNTNFNHPAALTNVSVTSANEPSDAWSRNSEA